MIVTPVYRCGYPILCGSCWRKVRAKLGLHQYFSAILNHTVHAFRDTVSRAEDGEMITSVGVLIGTRISGLRLLGRKLLKFVDWSVIACCLWTAGWWAGSVFTSLMFLVVRTNVICSKSLRGISTRINRSWMTVWQSVRIVTDDRFPFELVRCAAIS
jgi:hypothetical protein